MRQGHQPLVFALCLLATMLVLPTPTSQAQGEGGSTVWGKLGIPQGVRALRDGLVNRRGNFPGLERKPPVKPIADPSNLEEGKPEMLKTAAEIKQDQDLKKQKIKAIKYLGEVSCGCYNKDGKVEAAFLEALEDCDPDVREAAIETLDEIVGKDPRCKHRAEKQKCAKCSDQCAVTCCTEKIRAKLLDLATGMDDTGCFKEPNADIRKAAKALFCKCPVPAGKPIVPEELIPPDPEKLPGPPPKLPSKGTEASGDEEEIEAAEADDVSVTMSDIHYGRYTDAPVIVDQIQTTYRVGEKSPFRSVSHATAKKIVNPSELLSSEVVAYKPHLGELLLQMPRTFVLAKDWKVVLVDQQENYVLARIIDLGGRRVLLAMDEIDSIEVSKGDILSIGLISKN